MDLYSSTVIVVQIHLHVCIFLYPIFASVIQLQCQVK